MAFFQNMNVINCLIFQKNCDHADPVIKKAHHAVHDTVRNTINSFEDFHKPNYKHDDSDDILLIKPSMFGLFDHNYVGHQTVPKVPYGVFDFDDGEAGKKLRTNFPDKRTDSSDEEKNLKKDSQKDTQKKSPNGSEVTKSNVTNNVTNVVTNDHPKTKRTENQAEKAVNTWIRNLRARSMSYGSRNGFSLPYGVF